MSSTWPLWNGTGAVVQVTFPQARSRSSGRFCTSSGPRLASSSRPGWRLGRTSTRSAAVPGVDEAERVARPGRVGAAVGVEQPQTKGLGAGRQPAPAAAESVSTTQGPLGGGGVDGGEEGVRRLEVEEERRQRVDGGGEPAGRVGVEAQPLGGPGPASGGAAGDGPPGALDLVGGREVEPPHLVQLQQERVAQAGGGLGVERPGEERRGRGGGTPPRPRSARDRRAGAPGGRGRRHGSRTRGGRDRAPVRGRGRRARLRPASRRPRPEEVRARSRDAGSGGAAAPARHARERARARAGRLGVLTWLLLRPPRPASSGWRRRAGPAG